MDLFLLFLRISIIHAIFRQSLVVRGHIGLIFRWIIFPGHVVILPTDIICQPATWGSWVVVVSGKGDRRHLLYHRDLPSFKFFSKNNYVVADNRLPDFIETGKNSLSVYIRNLTQTKSTNRGGVLTLNHMGPNWKIKITGVRINCLFIASVCF